ncbi:hypothetical protein IWQ62_001291 [Dispira parvispora]|uniref:PH domain-containing protein n=1 Tax=Dispira parvispora TaxID=1520584 RepID=A0A9W8AYQ8_9FUNG|nr:hypothetical protein IWQ62_001291 [Dispira parvispora]
MSDTKVEAPAPVPIAETKITEHDSAVNEEPVAKTAVDTPAEPVTTEKTPADAEAAPATQEAAKPKEVEEVKQEEAPAAQETDEQTKSAEVEAEEEEEVEPVTSGFLAQRGPRPLRLWQKRYFAFREEAYPLADLHLVYKKNTNRGLQLIRAAERSASGKAPETSKQVNDVFNNIASATVSGKGLLFYYKNDNDKTPLGIINLRNLAEGSPAAEKNIRAHAFSLKTETRDYYLAAASDKELKAWIKGVEQEIAKLAEQADPSEAEEFKSTLEQLTQGKAFAKAPVSAPAAEEAKDDAEAGAAPKTAAVSDNEVFSGSEPEPEAPAETKDVAETTPSASKRKSYFAAFDSFFKGLKNEPVPAKAEDKGKTPAEEPAADAPKDAAPAEAAPEAATAKVDDAAEAKEATEKSAEEESKPEASTPAGPSATENAKQKAKDIGAFISTKIFPKRTPEESGNKEAQASEADAPAKKDAESTPKEVEEAAAPAETTGDVATAPEAAKEEAEAAAEETTPARATSPIQRTLTKLLRPLHLNKGQEAAEKPAEDKEEADKPKEVAAEDKPAEAETAVEGETATAEARETTEVAAEEEKKVNRPTSFLRRLGTTLSRSGRPSTAAEPTEASKEEAAEAPKEETEAAAKEEAQPEATKADEETPADDASETPEVQSLKSGFLQKQSQFVKGYDRRFVTLTDSGKLMYGKSEKELKSHKSVNVTKTTQVVKIDDGKRPFTFDIITPSRTVRFVADSVEERTSWVDALAAYQETLPDPEPEAKGDDKAAGDKEAAAEEAAATTEEAPKLPEPIKAEDLTPEQPEVEAQPAKADAAPAAEEAAAPKEEPAAPQAEEGKAKKEEAAPAKE